MSSSSSVRPTSLSTPPRSSSLLTQPPPSSPPRSTPTNDDIEAVIKMATSSHSTLDRPLRDTRTQLFVGNLPFRVRWQDLKDLFRRAGTVLRADVSLGPDNRSRGYGTVLLATAEDAGRAIDMFNGYNWQTRVLEVRPDRLGAAIDPDTNVNPSFQTHSLPLIQPGLTHTLSAPLGTFDDLTVSLPPNGELLSGGTGLRTLFVGNLPFHIQWQDLKDLFRAAGAVARADVALGPDGRSRGFGTVTFVTEDGAERARRMFDGYEFNGRLLKVHYDKFASSSQNNPLVGVSPQVTPTSVLSPYDSISQLATSLSRLEVVSAHDGRAHTHFDPLIQSTLHLGIHRSRLEAEGLSSAQLDAILARPRSTSFKSPSLTPSTVLSQSPSLLQAPALLQPQGQPLSGSTVPQPILPPAASLSQPHSLSASPLSISAKLSSSGSSSRNFGSATDLTLVTDLNDIRHTPDSFTSIGTSFGSPRPSLSAGSQPSSFSSSCSRRPNLSTSSRGDVLADGVGLGLVSQRTSFSSPARPSFGAANIEKPSLGIGAPEKPVFSISSERTPLASGNSQRLSASLVTLQNLDLDASSQKSSVPFLEDDAATLEDSRLPSLAPIAMPLNILPSKGGLHLGLGYKTTSPPSLSRVNISTNRSDRSGVGSPENRCPRASPSTQPSRRSSGETHLDASPLTRSVLNNETSDATWAATKPQLRKDPAISKANGTVDYVTTALGALGMRRANRVQNKQAEEKRKSSSPSGEPSSADGHGKKSTQASSHRHPGPISLPPPTTFTLPPGVIFSPHAHPQSPVYHPGYPLSPVHPHPMGSPLHHPLGSPLHHPAVHSPLHHPGHPQYGTYPHHAVPVHYGVITPHGLPPITPSMPPFIFAQTSTQNGHGHEDQGVEHSQYVPQSDGSQGHLPKWEPAVPVSQAPYYPPPSSNPPQHQMQYTQVHPHMFSPGVPLSPGIIVPLSPGVPMPMAGGPVTMTPGVALTPGVTMTPGALWPHAPWMNPAVGAPVHAANRLDEPPHVVEGYFPPVTQPSGDTGYFPPVSNIANDILKEDHGLASGPSYGDSARDGHVREGGAFENSPGSSPPGVSRVTLPDPSQRNPQDSHRKASPPQVMKRSSSAQCEGGFPKRNGLLHRESDPEVKTATNKGSKEA